MSDPGLTVQGIKKKLITSLNDVMHQHKNILLIMFPNYKAHLKVKESDLGFKKGPSAKTKESILPNRNFLHFLLLSLTISLQMHYFLMLPTLRLNNKNKITKKLKIGMIDSSIKSLSCSFLSIPFFSFRKYRSVRAYSL